MPKHAVTALLARCRGSRRLHRVLWTNVATEQPRKRVVITQDHAGEVRVWNQRGFWRRFDRVGGK